MADGRRCVSRPFPEPGEFLVPKSGGSARVFEDYKPDSSYSQVLFCNALYDEDGWGLTNESHGLKCLIHCRDHGKVKMNVRGTPFVNKLVVLKYAQSQKAIICGVCDE